jgi:recombination protein RecA
MPQRAISTGSLRLDIALGMGGIPRGEFIEISGGVSSGKTTLCQHIIAEAQKMGDVCTWIDVDHSLDPDYALRCGINTELLYVCEPEKAEQALGILEILAGSGSMAVVVLDSITSLVSQDELRYTLIESPSALVDRLLSQTLRRLYQVVHNNGTIVIFTNQVKTRISNVYHNLAQNLAQLALRLHAGLSLELLSLRPIQKNGATVGNRIQVRVIKNQFTPCFQRTGFDIMYGKGIFRAGEIFDLGVQLRIICKQSAGYFFKDQKLGARQSEALIFFNQNTPIAEEIEKIIRLKLLSDFYPAAR